MTNLIKRLRRAPPPPKTCHILAAPAEIRLAIYKEIAPGSFLPFVHYRHYVGLFLSCKQIRNEMEYESLRCAPEVLRAAQEYHLETVMKVRPLRPTSFGSLMHVSIGVPRWALLRPETQEDIFDALGPLLKLHLSSLTIGFDDLECQWDLYQLINELNVVEFLQYMDAHDDVLAGSGEQNDKAKYYNIRTTYADVIAFATGINCLVAPELCNGLHEGENHWCIRSNTLTAVPARTCNVRKIVLLLRKLHGEVLCHCGKLPHDVYPTESVRLRWSPTDEVHQLRKHGWHNLWTDEHGVRKLVSRKHPAQFVWYRVAKKDKGSVTKAVKGFLKGSRS